MHPCLGLPEILRAISNFVISRGGKCSDLLALAITNRSFTEVALDVLWNEQTRLDVLIKCFPEDLWCVRKGGCIETSHFDMLVSLISAVPLQQITIIP